MDQAKDGPVPLYRTASFDPGSFDPGSFDPGSFEVFRDSLAQDRSLPLSEAVDDESFAEAFERHAVDFGDGIDAVYTPAITLWALVSQALFSGVQRSCSAAVTRVSLLWAARGRRVVDTNNGDYCRARQKIPFEAVREITNSLADRSETEAVRAAQIGAAGGDERGRFAVPHVAATAAFVPKGRRPRRGQQAEKGSGAVFLTGGCTGAWGGVIEPRTAVR